MFALAVPEAYEGVGPLPVELAVALRGAGAARGAGAGGGERWRRRCCWPSWAGRARPSGCCRGSRPGGGGDAGPGGRGPYALDADAADAVFAVTGRGAAARAGATDDPLPSLGPGPPALPPPAAAASCSAAGPAVRGRRGRPDWARLATAAQALGVGQALLRPDGGVREAAHPVRRARSARFQAVKHRLADTLLGLEFARPLLFGAAVLATGARAGRGRGGEGGGGRGGVRGRPAPRCSCTARWATPRSWTCRCGCARPGRCGTRGGRRRRAGRGCWRGEKLSAPQHRHFRRTVRSGCPGRQDWMTSSSPSSPTRTASVSSARKR